MDYCFLNILIEVEQGILSKKLLPNDLLFAGICEYGYTKLDHLCVKM
jgi:hypothetical protein